MLDLNLIKYAKINICFIHGTLYHSYLKNISKEITSELQLPDLDYEMSLVEHRLQKLVVVSDKSKQGINTLVKPIKKWLKL